MVHSKIHAGQPREFGTTRWSVVLRIAGGSPEEAHAALEVLCRDYWYPIYLYVRRRGYSQVDASDLTQDFFAKLLGLDFTRGLEPEGGKFRSYLLTALNRFLISEWRKTQRLKRGAGVFTDSLDQLIAERGEAGYLAEASHNETPDRLYQRAWAETLLQRVVSRLGAECARKSDPRFEVLRPFLCAGEDPPGLDDAAFRLGLTLSAFKALLHRFRQRYREILHDEVRQTVGSGMDVAEELTGLLQALRGQ